MNADHFSIKGSSHRENQDYAISGNEVSYSFLGNTQVPYAVVSDGCSGAPYSDVGARTLTHCLKQYLYFGFPDLTLCRNTANDAAQIMGQLGLPIQSLDATLLSVRVINDLFDVTICGDGVVVAESQGKLVVIKYESLPIPSGGSAPYYLRYSLSQEYDKSFRDIFSGYVRRHQYSWLDGVMSHEEGLLPVARFYKEAFPVKDTLFVAIATDGLDSFMEYTRTSYTKGFEKITVEGLIKDLFPFKNFNGSFVQRRMTRALEDLNERNIRPYDDLSIAAIVNK